MFLESSYFKLQSLYGSICSSDFLSHRETVSVFKSAILHDILNEYPYLMDEINLSLLSMLFSKLFAFNSQCFNDSSNFSANSWKGFILFFPLLSHRLTYSSLKSAILQESLKDLPNSILLKNEFSFSILLLKLLINDSEYVMDLLYSMEKST